jgi:hypothetical protein
MAEIRCPASRMSLALTGTFELRTYQHLELTVAIELTVLQAADTYPRWDDEKKSS